MKQLTVYIYCGNKDKRRIENVILTNLVTIQTTRIQDT